MTQLGGSGPGLASLDMCRLPTSTTILRFGTLYARVSYLEHLPWAGVLNGRSRKNSHVAVTGGRTGA